MRTSRRRPRLPAGCERAKSSELKPRASSRATARASPSARLAVVLEVGARPSGQASSGTLTSRCTSENCGQARLRLAGHADDDIALALEHRHDHQLISSDSPELDSASTTSASVIMPRSPWLASPGCTKKAGVPVEAKRGGDLVGDVAGLAHAGADHAARAGQQQPAGWRRSRHPSAPAMSAMACCFDG